MYKLVNIKTGQEIICNKIQIENFDYYVSDKCNDLGGWHIDKEFKILSNVSRFNVVTEMKEVIATTNPNIDIPKVKEMSDYLAKQLNKQSFDDYGNPKWDEGKLFHRQMGFIDGYNKSQETHPFSLDDVKEIINLAREQYWDINNRGFSSNTEGDWSFKYSTEDEIIQKYQENKVLTIFYE